METPKKRGRPVGWRKAETKTAVVRLRCASSQKAKWKAAADRAGKSLAAWIIGRIEK